MSRNPIYIKLINSQRWRRLRCYKMLANPICEVCEAKGISTLAVEVHHVTPVESAATEIGMQQLMYDVRNLQALCHSCHVEIHTAAFSHSKEAVQANNKRATQRFADKFLSD